MEHARMLDNYTISWVISYDIDNKFCSKFTRKIRLKETNANKLYANYEKYIKDIVLNE